MVISAETNHYITFKGPEKDKRLILIHHNEHYDIVTSLTGFFNRSYFCLKCERGYDHEEMNRHPCHASKCNICQQKDCKDKRVQPSIHCNNCNRRVKGDHCMLLHKSRNALGVEVPAAKSICALNQRCKKCGVSMKRSSAGFIHECGERSCPSCGKLCDLTMHKCFLAPIKIRKEKEHDNDIEMRDEEVAESKEEKETTFVYFDIESMQETGDHIPNLLCCQLGGSDMFFDFPGTNCVSDFIDFLHTLADESDGKFLIIAHNLQGYDGYMIIEEYYKRFLFPSLIVNGAKILSMEIDKFKFIDSLSFLPMSLAAMGKSFGITELKKGFFPHFFNTEANQNYQGVLPSEQFFDPDGMGEKRCQEFLQWYQVQTANDESYHFQEQLLTYCQSDVQLLRLSCESFMTEFEEIVGANPMESRITIASACNMAYRMNWMPENKIAVEPFHGWRPKHVHSKVSIEWLLHCERQLQQEVHNLFQLPHLFNMLGMLVKRD